jgi:hypothetical protein
LHPRRTCREADRQQTRTVALLPARLMILRKSPARVGPGAFPNTLHAPGPAATSTELTGPVLRAGPDVETRPHSPSGGYAKGNRGRVRMSSHRAQPHAGGITQGRSGIPWAEKWPSIGILLECRHPDIRAESDIGGRGHNGPFRRIDSFRTGVRGDRFR